MSALRLSRRGLFGGFAALLAAPAIVRVASIMPVVAAPAPLLATLDSSGPVLSAGCYYRRYSGYDALNVSVNEVITAAKHDYAQQAVHVTTSSRELWLFA